MSDFLFKTKAPTSHGSSSVAASTRIGFKRSLNRDRTSSDSRFSIQELLDRLGRRRGDFCRSGSRVQLPGRRGIREHRRIADRRRKRRLDSRAARARDRIPAIPPCTAVFAPDELGDSNQDQHRRQFSGHVRGPFRNKGACFVFDKRRGSRRRRFRSIDLRLDARANTP